jgi:hypothetical protein
MGCEVNARVNGLRKVKCCTLINTVMRSVEGWKSLSERLPCRAAASCIFIYEHWFCVQCRIISVEQIPQTDFNQLMFSIMYNCYEVAQWLRHYATSRKVAGSTPDYVNFYIYLILLAALGPGVYSASNRNEYQKHK